MPARSALAPVLALALGVAFAVACDPGIVPAPLPERLARTADALEVDGVTATYFDDTALGHAVVTRPEPGLDRAWGAAAPAPGVPADGWSARFTAALVAPTTERYTLALEADDTARVFLDGALVLDASGGPGATAAVDLVAGERRELRVELVDAAGDASLRLAWETASRPREVIPGSALKTNVDPSGLAARPANPTCLAPPRPDTGGAVRLERALGGATFALPVAFAQERGGGRVFVVEKGGNVKAVDLAGGAPTTFVALGRKVSASSNEAGLLGFALHPEWPTRAEVFLSYTAPSTTARSGMRSVVARYRSTDGGVTLDVPTTADELLSVDQPYSNHNGGGLAFGPGDHFLYFALGDGGSGGDPDGNGQDTSVLLGKMLRIDPETRAPGKNYGIPSGNPFASGAGGRPEIFAYGLRNPWRFSFDRAAPHALWAGDVGQNAWEEIDVVTAGGNYGWNVREGRACYNASTCQATGFVAPVHVYGRSDGYSVTGGYVYRGAALPWLRGQYVFGDFGSGRVWALPAGGGPATKLLDTGLSISAFGEDDAGELYVLDYSGGGVHALVPDVAPGARPFPTRLSQTGCFDAQDPTKPVAGLVPYDVVAPLWSDGAAKERYVAVPDGAAIDVLPDGDLDLPVGSVTVKTFALAGRRVETRLFVRHDDGQWAGYSYAWNAAGTDAVLVDEAGASAVLGGQTWAFPSRAQCMQCHTAAAGRTLGLELGQLNRDFAYGPGRTANQLATWAAVGFFARPLALPPAALPRLASPAGTGPLEDRARAWLHANCSHCHRPGGGGGTGDLRFATSFADTGVCGTRPSHGTVGGAAVLLAPGDAAGSILSQRIRATGAARMPPVGTRVVDDAGADLIDAWIASVAACP